MKTKILPRNSTAINAAMIATVTGNPDNSRLESGVGNCFPGLEFDIRNLERRFFPYLLIEVLPKERADEGRIPSLLISEVDMDGVNQDIQLAQEERRIYRELNSTLSTGNGLVPIDEINGNFGPYGTLNLTETDFDGSDGVGTPWDAWTAIRLIRPDESITIRFRLSINGQNQSVELTANRVRYLNADGALSPSFNAGEMTQTLCQPWTYDFRDCGCWYWATNHPDTVQAEVPPGAQPNAIFDRSTNWLRSQKVDSADNGPPVDSALRQNTVREMTHYELPNRWNELGVVLEGREQGDVYSPSNPHANPNPLPRDRVYDFLRYAASVEHSVMTEYLSAVYSLNPNAAQDVADDVRAAHAEILRIAYGEMRHMRLANDLLRQWCLQEGLTFKPVLAPAAVLPAGGGNSRPVDFRPLSQNTLDDFINIERPSFSVDGLYARLLDSMRSYAPNLSSIVETIIAEGNEHFETFIYIKEWLSQHNEGEYLLNLRQPSNSDPQYIQLRNQYHTVLNTLYSAYAKGLPAGATEINQARQNMVEPNGLRDVCRAVRDAGLLVRFDVPSNDLRFTPVDRPTI